MEELKSSDIKEYLRAQIRNHAAEVNHAMEKLKTVTDQELVSGHSNYIVKYNDRLELLKIILCWIEATENR